MSAKHYTYPVRVGGKIISVVRGRDYDTKEQAKAQAFKVLKEAQAAQSKESKQ